MDERALWAKRCSETEQRKRNARLLYELEMECRRQGWDADTALRYDEEKDLFCFTDGRFAPPGSTPTEAKVSAAVLCIAPPRFE
jgi:hypothetical protein